ncbi:MAG: hypothetical protein IMY84_02260 [Chloroflexi bacterium]|nr:hypothetical protein [Chloroflexota bacterium]
MRRRGPGHGEEPVNAPEFVTQLLARGETLEAGFRMTGCAVYATSTRLIRVRGKDVTSFDYHGLVRVRESTRYNVWFILCGAAFIAMSGLNSVFPVTGAALIFMGIVMKSRVLEISSATHAEPLRLEGDSQALNALLLLLKGKRPDLHG